MDTLNPAVEALDKFFGHRKFLDGQESVVTALLARRDALVVMPTGGGKSLCYQLPALCLEGVTVVISPLIALMKDQVDGLVRRGISACMLNSSMDLLEQRQRLSEIRQGQWKLVYIAPERFRSQAFVAAMADVKIALFAIDEAHCLSQWGHDFRPDYLRLGEALERIGRPQIAAFTATATPEVRDDIRQHLRLREPYEVVRGFSRPNLSLNISHTAKVAEKFSRLREIIRQHKTGIIYCATRKRVEEVYEELVAQGLSIVAYHAGLDDAMRARAQDLFISKKKDVVVATNAFGMGIDRSDVRFVIHFEIPGSLEAYYQEAGRAGRDGGPSWCELFWNYADTKTQEFFIEGNNPSPAVIKDIYDYLYEQRNSQNEVLLTIKQIAEGMGLKNEMQLSSAISLLSRSGVIERFEIKGQRMRGTRLLRPDLRGRQLPLDTKALAEKERRDFAKLDSLAAFCDSIICRQHYLLHYFGEKEAHECGTCDMCQRNGQGRSVRDADPEELTLVRKVLSGIARMSHKVVGVWQPRYGRGKIIQMLMGSQSQEVLHAKLDELTTYGLLKDFSVGYLTALFRELQSAGLIEYTSGDYPKVTLTRSGDAVMMGHEGCRLRWPKVDAKHPGGAIVDGPFNTPSQETDRPEGRGTSFAKDRSPPAWKQSSPKTKGPRRSTEGPAATRGPKITQFRSDPAPWSQKESADPARRSQKSSRKTSPTSTVRSRSADEVIVPFPPSRTSSASSAGAASATRPLPARLTSLPSVSAEDTQTVGFDQALFSQLKEHRTALASQLGVAPFEIFGNATLEFITRLKPTTLEAAARLRGIGEEKATRFAAGFIEIVKQSIRK